MHILIECFNSFLLVFYVFRTSYVHHQEGYTVVYLQPYIVCFSCICARSKDVLDIDSS